MRKFTIFLLRDHGDEGFTVLVPELPGCQTEGETIQEAMDMARDAIAGHVASMQAAGDWIPDEPTEVIVASVEVDQEAVLPAGQL